MDSQSHLLQGGPSTNFAESNFMSNVLKSPITLLSLLGLGFWFLSSFEIPSNPSETEPKSSIVLRIDSDQLMVKPADVGKKRPGLAASKVSINASNFTALKADTEPQGMLAAFHEPCSEQPFDSASREGATRATILGLRACPAPTTFAPTAAKSHNANLPPPRQTIHSGGAQATLNGSTSIQPARYHRIVDGDDLHQLATQYLASPNRHLEIFEANRDKLTHPDLLPIGETLAIPPR